MSNNPDLEVVDDLIALCRAGRSGRKLSRVAAYAKQEQRLLADRAELIKAAAKSDGKADK
jgi:hypothetical protein